MSIYDLRSQAMADCSKLFDTLTNFEVGHAFGNVRCIRSTVFEVHMRRITPMVLAMDTLLGYYMSWAHWNRWT